MRVAVPSFAAPIPHFYQAKYAPSRCTRRILTNVAVFIPVNASSSIEVDPASCIPVPARHRVAWMHTAPAKCAGARVSDVLTAEFSESYVSASAAKRAVRRGEIMLGDCDVWRVARLTDCIAEGTKVARVARVAMARAGRVDLRRSVGPAFAMEDTFVRYRDAHVAVVVKPFGVRMEGELKAALFFAVADEGFRNEPDVLRRPKNVHRLDVVTGGLVVAALTKSAIVNLSEQFASRVVRKTYRAVLEGHLCLSGAADTQIVNEPVDGREAETHVSIVGRTATRTEVILNPRTGRRHQLRRHLAYALGHPVVYDSRYGARARDSKSDGQGILLWAEEICFLHPCSGKAITVHAAPPTSFDSEMRPSHLSSMSPGS